MSLEKLLCTLDYLIGTLATAYKGSISSLVMKDFSMIERHGAVSLSGTILSIPAGSYQACLLHEGIEICRDTLQEGSFALQAPSSIIAAAKNLQIDLIQTGRHIGTFLLKREHTEGLFFIPALEISEEMKGIDFSALTRFLSEERGLLKTAEQIIADRLSTKKDWKKLSEKINTFAKDLFWFNKEAYCHWYPLLIRWAVRACERSDAFARKKSVANVLSMVEIPLSGKSADEYLRDLVETWVQAVGHSSVDLSACPGLSKRILLSVHRCFPEMDITFALKAFLDSLKSTLTKFPALNKELCSGLAGFVAQNDLQRLSNYSKQAKETMLDSLSLADMHLAGKQYEDFFLTLDAVAPGVLDDQDMIVTVLSVVERNVSPNTAERLEELLRGLFALLDTLSEQAYRAALGMLPRLVQRIVGLKRPDLCEKLLTLLSKYDVTAKSDLLLNQEIAEALLWSGSEALIEHYKDLLKKIVIPAPKVMGFSQETWAEIVAPLHLERLSKFLSLLKMGGNDFDDILTHVVCNVYITGVVIPDDRIFQRQVSEYLKAHGLKNNFFLNYLLLKKLPVYYNDVGATGQIREDSTQIDAWGNDILLYFLRKQIHVTSSNHSVAFIESILKAWYSEAPDLLKGVVPDDVFQRLEKQQFESFARVLKPLFTALGIAVAEGLNLRKLLKLTDHDLIQELRHISGPEEIAAKILLVCRLHRSLVKKYTLIERDIKQEEGLSVLEGSIRRLKYLREIVLSPLETAAQESLYFKRHIAFGIPSVIGSYHEPKFDALSEGFRIEEQVRTVLEQAASEIAQGEKEELHNGLALWIDRLGYINDLLQLNGFGNFHVTELLTVLKTYPLHLSQVIDILAMWQRELMWTKEVLSRMFSGPVRTLLPMFPGDELPDYLRGMHLGDPEFLTKAADIVLRNIMHGIPGLLELDNIIGRLTDMLTEWIKRRADIVIAAKQTTPVARAFYPLHVLSDSEAMSLGPLIGNKAKNLVYLKNKGLLIPHGVVLPVLQGKETDFFINSEGRLVEMLGECVREIEGHTGAVFGDARRPLLLSIRSGSYLSMPGILSSILFCGMNREIAKGLITITGDAWFAWDSYRRFTEQYGVTVLGIERTIFEEITEEMLREQGVALRQGLAPDHLRELVSRYHQAMHEKNLRIPDSVHEQLRDSVRAVLLSWSSKQAVTYRERMKISHSWGTSVLLMEMICGNAAGAGASVFFTRNPLSFEKAVYGETVERATGDDIVSGTSQARMLSRYQTDAAGGSLEESDPALFSLHGKLAREVEQAMGNLPQEIEAAYIRTSGEEIRFYVLQTRRMEFRRSYRAIVTDVTRWEQPVLCRGIGLQGGMLRGVVTFLSSVSEVKALREKSSCPVILLRDDVSTSDVSLLAACDGIVTVRGGVMSHVSILAGQLGLTAVAGCRDMSIQYEKGRAAFAVFEDGIIMEGEPLCIDGMTGLIFRESVS